MSELYIPDEDVWPEFTFHQYPADAWVKKAGNTKLTACYTSETYQKFYHRNRFKAQIALPYTSLREGPSRNAPAV